MDDRPDELRRPDFPVLVPMATRWADDDHYGHANNVAYYSWFDTAVNTWLIEASGVDIRALDAIGVVAETSCRYLFPVGFPDRLQVGLRVDRLGRKSITYRLGVFTAGREEPCAVGRFVHVYVDVESRRPVEVPVVRDAAMHLTSSPSTW